MDNENKIYRYLAEKYLDSFLEGKILFRPLSYYRDIEMDGVRSDMFEDTREFRPEGGLKITFVETGKILILPRESFLPKAKADDIFVSCMSTKLDHMLFEKFDPVCVEISNVKQFSRRIRQAIELQVGKKSSEEAEFDYVKYYKPSDPLGPTWALPEQITLSKPEIFSWQNEYRIAYPTNGAFDFENVEIEIGAQQPSKETNQKMIFISIGNIKDIVTIHRK